MILEALFKNKPVAGTTVNTPQKPVQPLAPPPPRLSNILATQAVASVAGWHERKNAHAEKQARREKAEQKLLPFEKQNLPRLEPFTEPEPCLILGDVSLPWIDKKFVLNARKKMNGETLPAFASYNINDDGKCYYFVNGYSNDGIRSFTFCEGDSFKRYTHQGGYITHKWTGVIPDASREKIVNWRKLETKNNQEVSPIFLIEEAYAWDVAQIDRKVDPLLVVERNGHWYLLDAFDLTPAEQWLASEMAL